MIFWRRPSWCSPRRSERASLRLQGSHGRTSAHSGLCEVSPDHLCFHARPLFSLPPARTDELSLSVLEPINYPERFEALGLPLPAGILLYGPPGCGISVDTWLLLHPGSPFDSPGKTLLAKALANESGTNFISVKANIPPLLPHPQTFFSITKCLVALVSLDSPSVFFLH
jgi:hypothetical protein